jgi:hypothetical protein
MERCVLLLTRHDHTLKSGIDTLGAETQYIETLYVAARHTYVAAAAAAATCGTTGFAAQYIDGLYHSHISLHISSQQMHCSRSAHV